MATALGSGCRGHPNPTWEGMPQDLSRAGVAVWAEPDGVPIGYAAGTSGLLILTTRYQCMLVRPIEAPLFAAAREQLD
jgi:hypothetical protein